MSRQQVMFLKVLYVMALISVSLALGLIAQQGVDAQVQALPHYAEVMSD